jgi:hypothetical protein
VRLCLRFAIKQRFSIRDWIEPQRLAQAGSLIALRMCGILLGEFQHDAVHNLH